MNAKSYVSVASVVFLLVASVHLARIALGLTMTVNGWSVPFWISAAGLIITGFMAYEGFRLTHRH